MYELAMAMNGLLKSSSLWITPVARSKERCGARSKPFLIYRNAWKVLSMTRLRLRPSPDLDFNLKLSLSYSTSTSCGWLSCTPAWLISMNSALVCSSIDGGGAAVAERRAQPAHELVQKSWTEPR